MSFLYPDKIEHSNGPLIPPGSPEGQERRKWEQHYGPLGSPGNPYVYREYPKTLYKAGRPSHTNIEITGSITAHDADEEARLRSQGWAVSQEAAIEAVKAQHVEFSKLAAERHYQERFMSEPAQREAAQADEAAGVQHLPAVPETPVRRRGRPAKGQVSA